MKKIGDKYNYIFIDEYQDTSSYVLDIFYDAVKNRENVQMEKYSKWRYSGESDLIFAEVKNGRLSYERAMEFHLDNMLRDKAIISVNQFFEKIVRIGQEGRSMNQIGNKLGIDKGKQVVFDALLEKMPMHMGDVIKQEKYFCVKNIQK